jgi:drug/metabolite transporter (DMT)-like permease
MNAPVALLPLESRTPRLVVLCLAAVYFIWGSTYLAMRVAVEGLPPFFMASTRFLLTGFLLLVFLRLRGAAWPTRREWVMALPVGTLMFATGNGTVALAEQHISSGIAAVVCGTMPLWAAGFGPFFGERTSPREWVGLAVGQGGTVVLFLGKELRVEPAATALLFCAPVSWALGSLLARYKPLPRGLMSAATQMLTGGAVMSVVSRLAGEPVPTPASVSTESFIAWVYLAVFGSLVAYSAYTYLLKEARPAVATSYSYVNPAIAVLMGVAMRGETAGVEVWAGVALIITATVLVVAGRTRGAPQPSSAPTVSPATGR